MRSAFLVVFAALAFVLAGCDRSQDSASPSQTVEQPAVEATVASTEAESDVSIVVAPSVQGRVDESLVLEAYRLAVAQADRDLGVRPQRPVTIYVDPDSAIGLEDALGLSSRYAIHLRAGRTRQMETLLPLMLHEYTHVLQYSIGRLRPQWWIEGQAEHEGQRILEPDRAAKARRSLLSSLAADMRNGRAPSLASLRGDIGWDEYIRRSGAGRAYGWGQAAVTFIEDRWGFEAVARLVNDAEGPNSLSSFDEAIRRETGLTPAEFEKGLRDWLLQQA
jgi:hypothetical protein